MVQVVLLPPSSTFPLKYHTEGVGWARPPAEGCEANGELVVGATISAPVHDLVQLTRLDSF